MEWQEVPSDTMLIWTANSSDNIHSYVVARQPPMLYYWASVFKVDKSNPFLHRQMRLDLGDEFIAKCDAIEECERWDQHKNLN